MPAGNADCGGRMPERTVAEQLARRARGRSRAYIQTSGTTRLAVLRHPCSLDYRPLPAVCPSGHSLRECSLRHPAYAVRQSLPGDTSACRSRSARSRADASLAHFVERLVHSGGELGRNAARAGQVLARVGTDRVPGLALFCVLRRDCHALALQRRARLRVVHATALLDASERGTDFVVEHLPVFG